MRYFQPAYPWLKRILPDGMVIPSGTIITGPGGSGKLLVGAAFVTAWLKQGGNLVLILANATKEYTEQTLALFDLDASQYQDRILFAELHPDIDGVEVRQDNRIGINLVIPENWDALQEAAHRRLPETSLGTLYFGAALNLLLFLDTYRDAIMGKLTSFLQKNSTIFAVSNNVMKQAVRRLEETADNVMFSRTDREMQLYLKILRMKGVPFQTTEIAVPLPREELRRMRNAAEKHRKELITAIRNVQ